MLKSVLLVLGVTGCAIDVEEVELTSAESELTASIVTKRLSFVKGRGHLDLSPMPQEIYGVVDGLVGWAGPTGTYAGFPVQYPAFKTASLSPTDGWQHGLVELTWTGTVSGVAGSEKDCRIYGPELITYGKGRLEGDPFPTSTVDASATVWANIRVAVDSAAPRNLNSWEVLQISTSYGSKTVTFNRQDQTPGESWNGNPYYFRAKAGAVVKVTASADLHAQSHNQLSTATVSIFEFGFPASTTPDVILLECRPAPTY